MFLRGCRTISFNKDTVGNGEIARNEQFLLFPHVSTLLEHFPTPSSNLKLPFQTLSILKGLRFVVWERVKKRLSLYILLQIALFTV